MKKYLALLFLGMIITLCGACAKQDTRLTEEGRSSIEIYNHFTAQLRSGELHKVHIGSSSWYDAVTSTSMLIRFYTDESGTRQLVYRERTPFVFWYYPPFDYYDGSQYYYKYKNDWFIDRSGQYSPAANQDFVGLRRSFLDGNQIISDVVYQAVTGYELETTMQSMDRMRYYTLKGHTDLNFQFSKIDVEAYLYNFETQSYELTDRYYFRYKNINADIPVEPPSDFNISAVVNQVPVLS